MPATTPATTSAASTPPSTPAMRGTYFPWPAALPKRPPEPTMHHDRDDIEILGMLCSRCCTPPHALSEAVDWWPSCSTLAAGFDQPLHLGKTYLRPANKVCEEQSHLWPALMPSLVSPLRHMFERLLSTFCGGRLPGRAAGCAAPSSCFDRCLHGWAGRPRRWL